MRRSTAVLALALVVWTLGVFGRSLWGDEFHSLHRLQADDFGQFLEFVRDDNHPPLGFLLPRLSSAVLGESHLGLRLPSLLAGLIAVVFVLRLARRLPDDSARRAAPFLFVLSSFAFLVFTEVRMYGLLALAVLGLLDVLLDVLERPAESGGRRWRATLWIAVGLYSHYYFFHYLLLLGGTVLVLAVRRAELRAGLARLVLPVLAAGLAFLPWAVWGLRVQLEHGRHSGGTSGLYLDLAGFAQGIAHLLYMNASLGGELTTYGVALPGTAAAGLLGLFGLVRLWRAGGEARTLLGLLLVLGVGVPLFGFAVAHYFPRASFNWRYIAGSCAPVVVLVAAGVGVGPRWLRTALTAMLVVSLAWVTAVNATSPGQEDYAGCVREILARARPGDAIVLKPIWPDDPERSPTGWEYYRTRVERPAGAVEPAVYPTRDHEGALAHERVWTFVRYRFPEDVLADLRAEFGPEEVTPVGPVLSVRVFKR